MNFHILAKKNLGPGVAYNKFTTVGAAVGGREPRGRPGRQQQQVGPPEGIRRADDGAGISIKCRVWGSTSSWQQGVQCAGPGKGAGPSIA